MRLVYCIDSLCSSGGTERVLSTKVNWLAARPDVEVHIVTLPEPEKPFFPLDNRVSIHYLSNPAKASQDLYKSELAELLNSLQPDSVIVTAGRATHILPSIPGKWQSVLEFHYTRNFLVNFVKGIEHLRLKPLHILKMRWLQYKLQRTARKYDLFVGLTKRDVGLWGNPKNMTFVHNPLSFRSETKSSCDNHQIIAVGSWTPAKGMDQLLEAFGPLAKHYPDWSVHLYGSGQDEQRLRNIIAKYQMESQVTLHSPTPDIASKLVEASIYAFPSRSDGFGLVITEAMECGLPTVAMDCPCGPCEIVTPQTGIVVPDGDIPAFREGLKKLMDNDDLRREMGKTAAQEVARFYPETIMPQWLKLLNNTHNHES